MAKRNFSRLLEEVASTPVIDLVPEPPKPSGQTGKDFWAGVITVSSEDTILDTYEKLVNNNILSAPVRAGIHEQSPRTYHGFVDMLDLVGFVVKKMDLVGADLATVAQVQERLGNVKETFSQTYVKDLEPGEGHRSSLASFPLTEEFSLYTVLELLAYSNCHRIPILNDHQKVSNIITSTMMLRFLHSHSALFPPSLKELRVSEFVSKGVITITENTRAIRACEIMAEKAINGLAVVDEAGKLVDVFSVKDLKGMGINAEQIWRLFVAVRQFKEMQRKDSNTSLPLVTAKKESTFTEVLDLFIKTRVHRVIIVDDEGHPTHRLTPSCLFAVALAARD